MSTVITNQAELEYRLLYSMLIAGKSEKFATAAMHRFMGDYRSPFGLVRWLVQDGSLQVALRRSRTGNYQKLERGFREAVTCGINLQTCTPEQLEQIHGIGPKTSRFFIIWTRPGAEFAALDTHVLKWLVYLGVKAPKSTPSGAKYAALEQRVLSEARGRGMTARELDAEIWDWCSAGNHRDGEWPYWLQRTQSDPGWDYHRIREEWAEEQLAREWIKNPLRDLLVLGCTQEHFKKFQRRLGPRVGRIEYVDRHGHALRCRNPDGWTILKLPGWERFRREQSYADFRELEDALHYFERQTTTP